MKRKACTLSTTRAPSAINTSGFISQFTGGGSSVVGRCLTAAVEAARAAKAAASAAASLCQCRPLGQQRQRVVAFQPQPDDRSAVQQQLEQLAGDRRSRCLHPPCRCDDWHVVHTHLAARFPTPHLDGQILSEPRSGVHRVPIVQCKKIDLQSTAFEPKISNTHTIRLKIFTVPHFTIRSSAHPVPNKDPECTAFGHKILSARLSDTRS